MLTLQTKASPIASGARNLLSAQITTANGRSGQEEQAAEAALREMAFVYHLTRSIRKDLPGPGIQTEPKSR